MGYFTQQIYNQPQSMYVDPRLDILQQSAATIQGRHDKAVSEMNAYDILAANIAVAEGDQAYKDQKVAELQLASKAIADSGDYALAQPRINQAAKGFLSDQNLIAMQENRRAIDQYNTRLQELGASALDFNPATNWSTIGEDGKARRFVAQVEQRKDWDKRAQEVTKLMADEMPLGLRQAGVDAYLQHGSIGGISDEKIRDYMGKAFNRFVNTEEGEQMYRKLTRIDGMDAERAQAEMVRFVHNVGSAQKHQRQQMNYMADQGELQARGFAHDIEMDDRRYQREMDLAAAKASAKGDDKPPVISPTTSILEDLSSFNEGNTFGTNLSVSDLVEKLQVPKTKIITPDGIEYEGFVAQNAVLDFGKLVPTEAGNFSHEEVKTAMTVYETKHQIENLQQQLDEATRFRSGSARGATGTTMDVEKVKSLRSELAELEKAYVEIPQGSKTLATKYIETLGNDRMKMAASVGKVLENTTIQAIPIESTDGSPNAFMVDGKNVAVKAVAHMTGKQMEDKFTDGQIEFMFKEGLIPNKKGVFGGVDSDYVYPISLTTIVAPSRGKVNSGDRAVLGSDYSKHSADLNQQYADFNQASGTRNNQRQRMMQNAPAVDSKGDKVSAREAAVDRLNQLIIQEEASKKRTVTVAEIEQNPEYQQLKSSILNFDTISDIERQRILNILY